MPGTKPDPAAMTDQYAEAAVKERRAHVGRSHGWELAIAAAVAVIFLGWAVWAFLLV